MPLSRFVPPQPVNNWTQEFIFTSGQFKLSPHPIRYFSVAMPSTMLEQSFKLVEDIPGSETWGYRAIFQRDVDMERVREELVEGYLKKTDKFKFFNPLTVALLPYDSASQAILDAYREVEPERTDGDYRVQSVDGIEIKTLADAPVGQIRWDKQRVMGVAIDGQHRLSALIQFAAAPTGGIDPHECQIPVTLLLFDVTKADIVKQVREIFIDINKTARPVSKVRQILLDDRDVFAIMARDLIREPGTEIDGIPYELVDWKRRGGNRPEAEQMTTLLVLYQLVSSTFDNSPRRVDSELGINADLRRQRATEVDFRTRSCIAHGQQATALLERFRERHKKAVMAVFHRVRVFENVIAKLDERLALPNGNYLREYLFKPDSKRDALKQRIRSLGLDPVAIVDDSLKAIHAAKDQDNLLTFSVGQRALFVWFSKLHLLYRETLEDMSFEAFGIAYADDINKLIAKGFFNRACDGPGFKIHEGLCISGDNLLWTATAARRLGAMLLLAVAAMRWNMDQDIVDSRNGRKLRLRAVLGKVTAGYEPVIDLEADAKDDDDEVSEIPELDDDDEELEIEDAPSPEPADLRLEAQRRVYQVLRWIRE